MSVDVSDPSVMIGSAALSVAVTDCKATEFVALAMEEDTALAPILALAVELPTLEIAEDGAGDIEEDAEGTAVGVPEPNVEAKLDAPSSVATGERAVKEDGRGSGDDRAAHADGTTGTSKDIAFAVADASGALTLSVELISVAVAVGSDASGERVLLKASETEAKTDESVAVASKLDESVTVGGMEVSVAFELDESAAVGNPASLSPVLSVGRGGSESVVVAAIESVARLVAASD